MTYAIALYWLIAGVAVFQASVAQAGYERTFPHFIGSLIVGGFMVPVRVLVKVIS